MLRVLAGLLVAAIAWATCYPTPAVASDAASKTNGILRAIVNTDWAQTLKRGPNGPIPWIVVDQFGYPTHARKVAVIRDPEEGYDASARFSPGRTYALVNVTTGQVAKEAPLVAWNGGAVHSASGDKAWWFDFSEVATPGKYAVVDIENGTRSAAFSIGDNVYREVMKHALRTFFYQRAGFAKTPKFAGAQWADGASHLGPGQDPESEPWPPARSRKSGSKGSQRRDLRGGWYDAGDYNKYTNWTARNIIVLLRAYEENPQAFRDDLNIPESGNGVPDLLDEVKWGLDWLVRMQNEDGSVLCIQALASGSPPSAAKGPSYYGPATTSATLMTAAAFAYASKIYSARQEKALRQFAEQLAKRARNAWDWAEANPAVRYYNNDDAKQPGSKGLAAGQQEMSDTDRLLAKVEAAVHLYALTGGPNLKAFIEANLASIVPSYGPTMWDVDGQELRLYYTRLPGISPDVRTKILREFLTPMSRAAGAFASDVAQSDPYRSPIQTYTWGSNKGKAMQARLFQLLALYADDTALKATARAAAIEYAHYIHGVNPLGLVYLTNMSTAGAANSADTMYHVWFAEGTRWQKVEPGMPGPPPGYLVGGPNPQYALDACCASLGWNACGGGTPALICKRDYEPPLAQPPLKSYLQFNTSWPANSWAVSEPSDAYQAYYIRLLASFAR